MKRFLWLLFVGAVFCAKAVPLSDFGPEPRNPEFSTNYMDFSVSPNADFYEFANGRWLKDNPVPRDKARMGAGTELQERNLYLLHHIVEDAAAQPDAPAKSVVREVGDLYFSAMDTNRLEALRFQPIAPYMDRIDKIQTTNDLVHLLADFHDHGLGGMFGAGVGPDDKRSDIYAFNLSQGGLSLPDRDYYLKDSFTVQRKGYVEHLKRMFGLLGESPEDAAAHAATVLDMETELARACRSRVDLRDPDKNYNKFTTADFVARYPDFQWDVYLTDRGIGQIPYVLVGQPEFFDVLGKMVKNRPLSDWQTYLRWHVLHAGAPYLHAEVEREDFKFFGKALSGQPEQEARWKRSVRTVDRNLGEALGQLYVEKCFPPRAKARMSELADNLRGVFRDHLEKVPWMSDTTRVKALAKFARFNQKIGYPDAFRDYSSITITRDDFYGNLRRCSEFETHRQMVRIGKKVDRTEWVMTPPTVNAYFNSVMNEIVFPAGILQPPFFDATKDDAVNYGAIGVIIGHEITHGYDDEGRKYDADGNLNDWWTARDAAEFDSRAQKIVDEYNAFEPLPGLHVNGKLTLGENLADLGGVSIAYDALERSLAKDPSKRKIIDGFTPEQRFFISFAQVWRGNIRDAELRRLITVDPHSPSRYRGFGPIVNYNEFFDAFGITQGDPMWRDPSLRARIW